MLLMFFNIYIYFTLMHIFIFILINQFFFYFLGNPGESTRYPIEQKNQKIKLINSALKNEIREIRCEGKKQKSSMESSSSNSSSGYYCMSDGDNNDDEGDSNNNGINQINDNTNSNGKNDYHNNNENSNTTNNATSTYDSNNKNFNQVFSCQIRSLESIFCELNILAVDLLKIDVEGNR